MQAGDTVQVTGGGYKGSTGVIQEVEGELAKVSLNSFGAPMTARIPLSQLQAPGGAAAATAPAAAVAAPTRLAAGDAVNVTGGGYKGSTGLIEALDGDLAKVKVQSFGPPMSVRIPISQLEKG
ncbi:MAG: KOW motif-containing protein [Chloroflexota bacterium]